MNAVDHAALADRFRAVKDTIPAHVTLVAVSKTRSVEEIRALYELGQRDFGENYPQELREKAPQLPPDVRWHFIGHLQRSNVKHVLPYAHLIHGVDSERLLEELNKRAMGLSGPVDVLLQVHIAQEETKHGFSTTEVTDLLHTTDPALRWPQLRIRGLMGMATNTDHQGVVAGEFTALGALYHALEKEQRFAAGVPPVLSMGMSGDAALAIACGSTMVRVGTAIFGQR